LINSAADKLAKTNEALKRTGQAIGEVIDRADKKIADARDKKNQPPTP
jgi:hypothetical protein